MSELVQVDASSGNELSDAELMQVQGGGILGDAWDWVTDKVDDAVGTVKHAVTHPIETLGKVAGAVDWLVRHIPRTPPRR